MTISGGTIDAYTSGGDGFDSNGELAITGGTVVVWTANTADNEPLDADGTPCREDAATAALVELFAPDCTRLARWQWLDTGCGCKVRRQTPDSVTTAPDGPDIRASLAAALTGEDAPC